MPFVSKRVVRPRNLVLAVLFLAVLLALMQLVPYGRAHENPPVLNEVQWNSPHTRDLVARACYDCHSNETEWPWYSNIAPLSWIVQHDVEEGRQRLNFSELGGLRESHEAVEVVEGGEMPPLQYKLRFWDQLSGSEKDELIAGLRATLGGGERSGR